MEEIRLSHAPTEQLSVALQAILSFLGFEKQFAAFCYDAMSPAPETRRTSRTPLCIISSTRGSAGFSETFFDDI